MTPPRSISTPPADTSTPNSIDILARTLWGEARGTGRAGMEAIAAVIMNRAAHPRWWGTGVIDVCQKHSNGVYQFSCWGPDDPNLKKLVAVTGADHAFVTALQVAEEALDGKLKDPTHNADSYFDTSIPAPSWAVGNEPTLSVAALRFYRLELPAPAGG